MKRNMESNGKVEMAAKFLGGNFWRQYPGRGLASLPAIHNTIQAQNIS